MKTGGRSWLACSCIDLAISKENQSAIFKIPSLWYCGVIGDLSLVSDIILIALFWSLGSLNRVYLAIIDKDVKDSYSISQNYFAEMKTIRAKSHNVQAILLHYVVFHYSQIAVAITASMVQTDNILFHS